MAFVPPKDDKIKKLGKKEKIPAYVFADPDDPTIIYIKTNGVIEILDNSVYEVVIPNLEFEDGEIIDVTCECPDYQGRYAACKHIVATMMEFTEKIKKDLDLLN